MQDCKVSVIVPVYNSELYIVECIESIVNQTYRNIEIIVVDDGSTDGSLDVLLNMSQKYDNMKVIHQENKGPGGARNRGAKEAVGQYIYFMDSDDIIDVAMIERCIDVMQGNKVEVVAFEADVFGDIEGKNTNQYIYKGICKEMGVVVSGPDFFIGNRYRIPMLNTPMLFFDKKFLVYNSIEFPENIFYEDVVFYYEFISKCSALILVDEVLYHRRYRFNSIMTSNTDSRKLNDKLTIYKKIARLNVGHELKNIYLYDALKGMEKTLNVFSSEDYIGDKFDENDLIKFYEGILEIVKEMDFLTRCVYFLGYKHVAGNYEAHICYDTILANSVNEIEDITGLNGKSCVGIYGTGAVADVFFSIYFEKRTSIPNNVFFIDTNKKTKEKYYRNRPVYNYKDVKYKSLKSVIILSELYDEVMTKCIRECDSAVKIFHITKGV